MQSHPEVMEWRVCMFSVLNTLIGWPGPGLDTELQREKVEITCLLKFACWSPSNWLFACGTVEHEEAHVCFPIR